MIYMDAWLSEFLSHNMLTLSLCIFLLQGIAKITPWATDDKLTTMLSELFSKVQIKMTKEEKDEAK
jgi:hypothetical protein